MPGWYPELLGSVSRHVSIGRRRAVRAANQELVLTYRQVGREILERQTYEGYGTQLVNRLSADLKHAFPESTGFSPRNLRYMRALAAAWPEVEIVQRSAAQLLWRHHQHLLDKLEDTDSRLGYAAQAVEQGWSRDVLAGRSKQGCASAQAKRSPTSTPRCHPSSPTSRNRRPRTRTSSTSSPRRNPGWSATVTASCSSTPASSCSKLGQGFALVGKQVRLTLGDDEFWCDLLFYHRPLRRYVVVELKAGALKADFVSKLGIYLAALDDLLAREDEKPPRSRRSGFCCARPRTRSSPSTRFAATPLPSAWPSGLLPRRTGFPQTWPPACPASRRSKRLSHLDLDGADR